MHAQKCAFHDRIPLEKEQNRRQFTMRSASSLHSAHVAFLPPQSGIFRPFLIFRAESMRPHLSSQFSSLVLNWIFHGSSNASNLFQ